MRHTIIGGVILLAAVTTLITGGTMVNITTPFVLVSIFDALNVISQVVAPVVGALIAAVIWIHNRLTTLEEGQRSLDSSVFGQKRNDLSNGVTGEVNDLGGEIHRLSKEIEELKKEVRDDD